MNIEQITEIADSIELTPESMERIVSSLMEAEKKFAEEEQRRLVTHEWLNRGYAGIA